MKGALVRCRINQILNGQDVNKNLLYGEWHARCTKRTWSNSQWTTVCLVWSSYIKKTWLSPFLLVKIKNPPHVTFLPRLDHRCVWRICSHFAYVVIACCPAPSPVSVGVQTSIFFFEVALANVTKTGRNVTWMVCKIMCEFHFIWKFKMASRL